MIEHIFSSTGTLFLGFLARHITKVPRKRDIHSPSAMRMHLVAREGLATGEILKLAAIKQVAAVDREH